MKELELMDLLKVEDLNIGCRSAMCCEEESADIEDCLISDDGDTDLPSRACWYVVLLVRECV